jgi:hypothetical protein
LRQSYLRVAKRAAMMAGRYAHAKQFNRHRRELRILRTRLGRLIRDIGRNIAGHQDIEAAFCTYILPDRRRTPTLDAGCYDATRVSFSFIITRVIPTEGAIAVLGQEMTRSRKTAAETVAVGFKAPHELTLPILSKPDPRLITLVGMLARRAARDFIQAAWDDQKRAAFRIKEGF